MTAQARRIPRRVGGRAVRPLIALAFVAMGLAGPFAGRALAHATLEETTPVGDQLLEEPPEQVVLRFDERVSTDLGGIRVLSPDGDRVDSGGSDLADGGRTVTTEVDSNARGTYTVAYDVVSDDGHPIEGSFVFHVGERTGAVAEAETDETAAEVVGTVGRWLAFAGTLVGVGLLVFVVAVVRGTDPAVDRLRLPLLLAGAAVVVGAVVALLAQVAEASGRSMGDAVGFLDDAISDSRFGRLALARVVLGIVLVAAALLRWHEPRSWTARGLVAVPAVGLLVVPALAGHAWTSGERGVAVLSDVAHLLAGAVWAGGLVGLLLAGRASADVERLARRFSAVALGAVGLVVVSGLVSGYMQVRSLDALLDTTYGKLLLAKVGGVAILVALGWLNRRYLLDLLRDRPALFNVVRAEVGVVVIVLALTAVLVDQVPARDALVQPYSETVMQGDRGVQIRVEPAKAGDNDVHLYFIDRQGLPAAVDAAELSVAAGDVPPRTERLEPITADHFSALGVSLPTPGRWLLRITSVREGQSATFTLEVPVR